MHKKHTNVSDRKIKKASQRKRFRYLLMNTNKNAFFGSLFGYFKIYLLKVSSELFVCETLYSSACLQPFTRNKEKHLQCAVSFSQAAKTRSSLFPFIINAVWGDG